MSPNSDHSIEVADHALVIGIDAYKEWPKANLNGAVRDALAFAGWLTDSGGVDIPNLHLVLGLAPDGPEVPEALRPRIKQEDAIKRSVQNALRYLKASVPPDAGRIWFYFSGHGIMAFNEFDREDAICCADFDPSNPSYSLTVDSIAQYLRLISCREQILLIDACRDAPVNRNVRLGKFDTPEFGRPPYAQQLVFKATSLGYEAAELAAETSGEGGAFTGALIKGLREGDGAAKMRDQDGNYIVKWSRLTAYVAADVVARHLVLPSGVVQQPIVDGERSPLCDPVLAQFHRDLIAPVELQISIAPDGLPVPVRYELRAGDGADDPVEGPFADGKARVTLPPAPYIIRAVALGYELKPRPPIIELFAPVISRLDLVEAPPPKAQVTLDPMLAPLTKAADRALVWRGADSVPVTTLTVECRDPIAPIWIETGGVQVASGHGLVTIAPASPGMYRAQALGPEGQDDTQVDALAANETVSITLQPPFVSSTLLDTALEIIEADVVGTIVMLPDQVGPAASVQVSTLATLAVGMALEGGHGRFERLRLAERWRTSAAPEGLHLVVINDTTEPSRWHSFRLWRQYDRNNVGRGDLRQSQPELPQMAEASAAVPAGHYWLEIRDRDRERQAGFKISCPVLPGRVTLVLVERTAVSVRLHLHSIRHAPSDDQPWFSIMRQAEAVQRARLVGRLTVTDPSIKALIAARWYEPFSLALTGFTLRRLIAGGETGYIPQLRNLARRLTATDPLLVDGWLLLGVAAELVGDRDGARTAFAEALERCAVPLVGDGLEVVLSAIQAYRLYGKTARWLNKKGDQLIEHRAWTLRREDDL